MQFNEHGDFCIDNNSDYLIVDATGPFNSQTIAKYEKELEKYIEGLHGKSWTQIIVLNGMSIFTPEAEEDLCNTLELRKNNGLFFSAVVHGGSSYSSLIEQQLSRCYEKHSINHTFFNEINEAKQYLSEQQYLL